MMKFEIKKKMPKVKLDSDSDDAGAERAKDAGHSAKKQKTDAGKPPPPSDPEAMKVADKLADFVAQNGAQFEDMTRSKNPPSAENPFRFLHDTSSSTYKYYEWKLDHFRKSIEESKAREASIRARGVPTPTEAYPAAKRLGAAPGASLGGPPPERRNRFSERPPEAGTSLPAEGAGAGGSGKSAADSLRLMEMYMRKAAQTDAERDQEAADRRERLRLGEDPRFKADGSRAHHMGDFIPQEELQKFMAKAGDTAAAAAAADQPDPNQIGADNKGHQLLAKMGWTEGAGLGAGGAGMTAPVQAGGGNQHGLGIGANAAVEVSESDDIYEQYKKRMMVGYKHRPNPLNNPRKAYY